MAPMSFHGRARRFWRSSRSGAVALIVAISVIPICMLCALVFDFGFVLEAKSQLDVAADAAALAAARTAAAGYAAGQTPKSTYITEGTAAGNQWFNAQAASVSEAQSFTGNTVVVQTGQNFTATVTYTAKVYEVIAGIFNWKNPNTGLADANIANTSVASITVNAYSTIDFVVDNTSSMMLAQDDTELPKLQAAVAQWLTIPANVNNVNQNAGPNGQGFGLAGALTNGTLALYTNSLPLAKNQYCAFACHWSASSTPSAPNDYWGVAKQNGVKLRYDEVQSATTIGIQEMESQEQALGQFSVGVFSFGGPGMSDPSYLKTVFAEAPLDTAANGSTVKNAGGTLAISALNAMTPPVTGDTPNTNIGNAINDVIDPNVTGQSVVPAGDGSTSKSPLKAMILVTDGVEDDNPNGQTIPGTEGPINPSVCSAIKNAGYTLYVLYTPYSAEGIYLVNSLPLIPYITGASSPSILSALQSCASAPADLIAATSPAGIQAGLKALVDQALVGATTKFTN